MKYIYSSKLNGIDMAPNKKRISKTKVIKPKEKGKEKENRSDSASEFLK